LNQDIARDKPTHNLKATNRSHAAIVGALAQASPAGASNGNPASPSLLNLGSNEPVVSAPN